MNIAQKKSKRDELHSQLNALVSQDSYSRAAEQEIREQIKAIQHELAVEEISNHIKVLEILVSTGEATEEEMLRLENNRKKLDMLV